MSVLARPLLERLQKFQIDAETGCWVWTGYVMPNGYAKLTVPGERSNLAYRLMYEEVVGPIPEGLDLDHECHNRDGSCLGGAVCLHRRCVNPAHCVPRTRSENLKRSQVIPKVRKEVGRRLRKPTVKRINNRDKTQCPQGHAYSEENTRYNFRGSRLCMTCDRERHRKAYRLAPRG